MSVFKVGDLIAVPDGGQPVSDDDERHIPIQVNEGLGDCLFRLGIQRTRGFVKDAEFRSGVEGTRKSEPLSLATA
jgi:hypothetical protein